MYMHGRIKTLSLFTKSDKKAEETIHYCVHYGLHVCVHDIWFIDCWGHRTVVALITFRLQMKLILQAIPAAYHGRRCVLCFGCREWTYHLQVWWSSDTDQIPEEEQNSLIFELYNKYEQYVICLSSGIHKACQFCKNKIFSLKTLANWIKFISNIHNEQMCLTYFGHQVYSISC